MARLSKKQVESIKNLLDAIEEEFDYVRNNHNVEGDNFSCSRFIKIAKERKKVKELFNI